MAEPILDASRVVAGVGQGVAAGDKLDAFEAAQGPPLALTAD